MTHILHILIPERSLQLYLIKERGFLPDQEELKFE